MKKKITFIVAAAALLMGGAAAVTNSSPLVVKADGAIQLLASEGTYSDDVWATATSYDMTPSATATCSGSVKFAIFGTDFYYRATIVDSTLEANDNPYTKLTFGTNIFEMDGKYLEGATLDQRSGQERAWPREIANFAAGNPRTCLGISYDDATTTYSITEKFGLGESFVVGSTIGFKYQHNNANGNNWEISQANNTVIECTINFVAPTPEGVAYINDSYSDSVWANAPSYNLESNCENTGTLKFAVVGNSFYYRATIVDSTLEANDNPYTKLTFGTNIFEMDGKYLEDATLDQRSGQERAWPREIANFAGGNPRTCVSITYDDASTSYTMIERFDLGETLVKDAAVNFTYTHYDAAGQAWGITQPRATSLTINVVVTEQENPGPVVPTVPTNNVYMFEEGLDDASWAGVDSYNFTTKDTLNGSIKFAIFDTVFAFRAVIHDESLEANDNPAISFAFGNEKYNFDGRYLENDTLTAKTATEHAWAHEIEVTEGLTGKRVCKSISYDEDSKSYTIVEGYIIGEVEVDTEMSFKYVHIDANGGAWTQDQTNSISFESKFVAKAAKERIVITDINGIPKESDWDEATGYEFTHIKGEPGSIGTMKVLTAKENIFFRFDIDDPKSHTNADAIEIRLAGYDDNGDEVVLYHAQGNFECWLSPMDTQLLGNPSLMEDSTTADNPTAFEPGVLTHKQGFYLKDSYNTMHYAPGKLIRLTVTHFDAVEGDNWNSHSNYAHIERFDEVMTFGEQYDDTIRPLTPVDGITLSSKDVFNTKATFSWNNVGDADNYKLFIFVENDPGAEEPYTYERTEGPIYAEADNYEEVINGFAADTIYAVQLMVYNAEGDLIGASNLVKFKTMTNAEYNEWLDNQTQPEPPAPPVDDGDKDEPKEEKKGCGGSVVASSLLVSVLSIVGITMSLKKKED